MTLWHTTGSGQLYGPWQGNVTDYKRVLRRAYGSLRGVKIANASDYRAAVSKLFFGYRTWDGRKWINPLPLIDARA